MSAAIAAAPLRPDAILGVLFDMDGLLLDTERLYSTAFEQSCAEHGWEMRQDVWARCIGTTDDRSREILAAGYGTDFPLKKVLARWRELYAELQSKSLRPMPGALELLAALREWRLPVGLVTSTNRLATGEKMNRCGLDKYFSIRVCGGEAASGKPSPDPYLLGARLLGLKPANILVLEDSDNGVRAGVLAGTQVIQIPDTVAPSPEILALGHTVHSSLQQTLELLRGSMI